MELAGKVALVTGASRGIGRATALELARRGAKVAVNYVSNQAAAEAVAADAVATGAEALVVAADVGDTAAVEAMVKAVQERWGRIDILVNNAGQARDGLAMRMDLEDWDFVLRTNLTSAFLCSKAVLRSMLRQRWGRIVNMSSIVGVYGNGGQSNYAAAKAGLIGYTKSLAKEVASRNVTVNALAPGWIETDMVGRGAGQYPQRSPRPHRRRAYGHRGGRGRHRGLPLQRRGRLHHRPGHRYRRRHGDLISRQPVLS